MDPVLSGKKVFMNSGRVRRSLAAACVLPLLLAGCSEDGPTPQMPDPTSSPSAVETDTGPAEPTLPPEAEGDGKEAAAAFVEHYYDYVNYAQATGDTSGLGDLGLRTCRACNGAVEFVDAIYERGGESSGGNYTVRSAQATGRRRVDDDTSIYYLTVITEHTAQVVTGAGNLDRTYDAGSGTLRYEVVRGQDGWHIANWAAA